jgi:hypothetical protein
MENDMISIAERMHQLESDICFAGCTNIENEHSLVDAITTEILPLLTSEIEIKKALTNMYFIGSHRGK